MIEFSYKKFNSSFQSLSGIISLIWNYIFMQSYRIGTKRPEIFSDQFLNQIFELNAIVKESGAQLEGNIFYKQATDFSTDHKQKPIGRFRNKRINLFWPLWVRATSLKLGLMLDTRHCWFWLVTQRLKYQP